MSEDEQQLLATMRRAVNAMAERYPKRTARWLVAKADKICPVLTADEFADGFRVFWDAYGKKVARKTAEKKWPAAVKAQMKSAKCDGITAMQTIADAAQAYRASFGDDNLKQCHPSTWLFGERWNDDRAEWGQAKQADVWPELVRFLADLDTRNGYTPQITERFGEKVAQAAKAVGVQEIKDADEFELRALGKAFAKLMGQSK